MRCSTCAILAGGAARRFGGITKSKLLIGGMTIMQRILNVTDGLFDEVIIISNTPGEFSEFNRRVDTDIIPGIGPLGGIHAALTAASGEAVFVVAGDMPLLEKKIIRLMLMRFEESNGLVLTPFSGVRIEPLHSIYVKGLAPEIEKYIASSKVRAVYDFLRSIKVDHFKHDNSEPYRRAFMNVNTPEDIVEAERIIAGI